MENVNKKGNKIASTLGRVMQNMQTREAENNNALIANPVSELQKPRIGSSRAFDAMSSTSGSKAILTVETSRCQLWSNHNRLYDLLDEKSCHQLIESIKSQGQKEEAIVRRVPDNDNGIDFEIICGARRLWVCRYLNISINISVVKLTDEEAFRISDASNIGEDISPYERAIEYSKALELYYNGIQQRMSQAIGMSKTQLHGLLTLADIDKLVIEAFPDPRKISIRQGVHLFKEMNAHKNRQKILENAKKISAENKRTANSLSATDIFKRLTDYGDGVVYEKKTYLSEDGGKLFETSISSAGGLSIVVSPSAIANTNVDKIIEAVLLAFKENQSN